MKLLLLSSSRVGETPYLSHARSFIQHHLGDNIEEVLFIPYAGVTISFDEYEVMVAKAFNEFGYQLKSIHHFDNPTQAVERADAIAVGGGNTFNLLDTLYQNQLIDSIKRRVNDGIPYIGWSAGSNITAPSIRTTNDMPIVEPQSFDALGLFPIQVNPHYIDGNPPGHNGETREQRINEFLALNPSQKVIGIPEGTALVRQGQQIIYQGQQDAFIFSANEPRQQVKSNADLSFLIS